MGVLPQNPWPVPFLPRATSFDPALYAPSDTTLLLLCADASQGFNVCRLQGRCSRLVPSVQEQEGQLRTQPWQYVRREELASCSDFANNGSAPVNPGCQTCATVAAFCDSNPNVDTSANITLGKRKIERYEPEDFWRRKATGKDMGAQKARAAQLARERQRLVAKQARFSVLGSATMACASPFPPRVRVLACSPLRPSPAHPLVRRIPGRSRP